jgi:hypothetical protein
VVEEDEKFWKINFSKFPADKNNNDRKSDIAKNNSAV